MSRYFLAFVFAIASIVGWAQDDYEAMAVSGSKSIVNIDSQDDESWYDWDQGSDFLEVNPHLSIGLSSVMQNYGKAVPGLTDFIFTPGCMMRAGSDVRFVIRNSFGLVTGLDFGINNSSYAMSIVDNATGTISTVYVHNHFYDMTVPVYLSVRLNIRPRLKWNIDAGIFYSLGLGGNIKVSGYTSGQNSIGQPIVSQTTHESKYFDGSQPLLNGVRRSNYGPRLATGLVFSNKYNINVVFECGMRNLAINHGVLDLKYRSISLAFQFGYIF